jgi:hypothetical protein
MVTEAERAPSKIAEHAIKSWRYLRLAIVVLAVALLIALLLELIRADWNLLPSISAYYYTPVHSIFVGSMVMIGACLLAIRGLTDQEDVMLNLAGLLAPVVALAPTVAPNDSTYDGLLSIAVNPLADNNLAALALAALVVVAGSTWLVKRLKQPPKHFPTQTRSAAVRRGWQFGVVIVVCGAVTYAAWGTKPLHNYAAILMFVCLWRAVVYNALRDGSRLDIKAVLRQAKKLREGGFPTTFAWIAIGMMLGPAIVGIVAAASPAARRNYTFWLELAEIAPFVAFWLTQTMERWYE